MRRIVSTVAGLGLLATLGACAGEVTARDPERPGSAVGALDGAGDEVRNPTAGRTGALPDGGAASCVESYAPRAVARRAFAFDGIVVAVGPSVSDRGDEADLALPGVTFEVQQWYSGGEADTVTVDLQSPTTGSAEPADPGYAYGIGSRLLVSGEARWGGSPLDAAIAWGCGFSRYWDPATAAAWQDATAAR